MKTIIYHIIFWTTLLCVGCNQEEDIVPTEGNEMEFILPQGNHDYDSEMVAFYEQYGVLPVYLFEKKDLYWNNTVQEDVVGLAGDPEYVGEVWDFSRHIFFDVYPDSLLRDYLPLKFFICSSLQEITKTGDGDKGTEVYARQGYDYFAVNYAGESFTSLSDRSKMDYSAVLNSLFLLRLPLEVPQEFVDLTDYSGGKPTNPIIRIYSSGVSFLIR